MVIGLFIGIFLGASYGIFFIREKRLLLNNKNSIYSNSFYSTLKYLLVAIIIWLLSGHGMMFIGLLTVGFIGSFWWCVLKGSESYGN